MRIIIALVCTLSMSALACPDLSGRFFCKSFSNGLDQDVTITQVNGDKATIYNLKIVTTEDTQEREYVADNEAKTVEDPNYTWKTERSYCADGQLLVEIKGEQKESGKVLDALVTVKLNDEGNLYDSYTGTLGEEPINFEEVCKRL
jgi:hypothetical protein